MLREKQILRPAYPMDDLRRLRGPRRAGSQDDNSSAWRVRPGLKARFVGCSFRGLKASVPSERDGLGSCFPIFRRVREGWGTEQRQLNRKPKEGWSTRLAYEL
jgi:hypothetical protein